MKRDVYMKRGSQQVSGLKETSMGQAVLYFHPRWRQASGSAGWVTAGAGTGPRQTQKTGDFGASSLI